MRRLPRRTTSRGDRSFPDTSPRVARRAGLLGRAVLVAAAFGLLACSTHYTTAAPRSGATTLYQISEPQALQLAHRALLETFPSRKVTPIVGPTRGFSTTYRMMLGSYSQQILVISMEGVAATRARVVGVSFEVSGSGTAMISGSSKNRALFRRVVALADATGTRVSVAGARSASFGIPAPAARETGSPADVEIRLRELRRLYERGLITWDQLQAKQKQILEDL